MQKYGSCDWERDKTFIFNASFALIALRLRNVGCRLFQPPSFVQVLRAFSGAGFYSYNVDVVLLLAGTVGVTVAEADGFANCTTSRKYVINRPRIWNSFHDNHMLYVTFCGIHICTIFMFIQIPKLRSVEILAEHTFFSFGWIRHCSIKRSFKIILP